MATTHRTRSTFCPAVARDARPARPRRRPAPYRAALLAGALLSATACGPSASVQEVPPGHLEYDQRVVRVYRDGARVEYLPVPEEIGGSASEGEINDAYAECFFLNDAGLSQIEETIASLDPSRDYPKQQCDTAPADANTGDLLYLEGFEHSPFNCPPYPCLCHPSLAPIAGVYGIVGVNLDGITPTDEDGNDLWYLDTTRTCTPGEWRTSGS